MTRSEVIRELLGQYQQQQRMNRQELLRREEYVFAKDPEIARLREKNRRLAMEALRAVMATTTPEEAKQQAQRIRDQGIETNAQIKSRLAALGLTENYLEENYRCDICRDTGYVGDAPARFCDCFLERVNQSVTSDAGLAGEQDECFETFSEARIPEENGQRAKTVALKKLCEEYADTYPDGRFRNLLITGTGGLGKTFLLNSTYQRIRQRGFDARRLTAYRMFEAMRQRHMGRQEGQDGFERLLDVPMLFIDDLGTEPMMNNITVDYLFLLLNERMAAKKHTFIATNLTPAEILKRYGERVASRLLDRTCGACVRLEGKDLRLI